MSEKLKVLVIVEGFFPREEIQKLVSSLVKDENSFYADHYVGGPGGAIKIQLQR